MLFGYIKRKVNIESQLEILQKKINSLSITDEEKFSLLDDLKVVKKSQVKANFKLKRTLVDKDIATNLLKQNVDELQNKNEIIESQIAFKEQILANVNHELRTPLNAIIGMSDLLQNTPLNDQQKKYTDLIKRSGDNLFIIINDFLTISSMKAGKFELRPQPFSLKEICQDLHNIFSIHTTLGDIDLVFESGDFTNDIYLGDATRIHQIFQNLLNNAIKFTNEGSVRFSCTLKEDRGQTKLIQFLIEDSGVGIPKHMQANIFDSFTQAYTASEKGYSGTGLGLNIVQHLVHLMKGSISFESEENVGTKFKVEIPFEHIQSNVAKKEDKVKQLCVPTAWKKYKSLLIEDNKANIFYAGELFKRWNLDLDVAENYKEGVEMAKSQNYDLILCDLNLPDGYGIDLINDIRSDKDAKSNQSKIAIITASILQSDKDKAAELDIIGYIEKPFLASTLLRELYKIFGNDENYVDTVISTQQSHAEEELYDELNKISTNPKVHLEFLTIFLKQFKNDIGDLTEAVSREEYDAIFNIAHKMKSSVKYFDPSMHHHVSLLEEYGSNNDAIELIKDEYQHLFKRSRTKIPELEKIAEKLTSSLR